MNLPSKGYGARVGVMGVVADPDGPSVDSDTAMEALIPIVTRVVRARVTDDGLAEDLVQETLVRVLARANRVAPGMLEPYAIVTAKNVVASLWTERDRQRRNQHRVFEVPGSRRRMRRS